MTLEEKQLLLKDLCARLPYGVKCKVNFDDGTSDVMKLSQLPDGLGMWGFCKDGCYGRSDDFKPYLRPMSSMTEGEILEFIRIGDSILRIGEKKLICILSLKQMDWLNEHQFDYRIDPTTGETLIGKGLALEAPKDMYIF